MHAAVVFLIAAAILYLLITGKFYAFVKLLRA
jgi:hypothetical protein